MSSTRLPGKHLLESNARPMIGHLIIRLKEIRDLTKIVIATTQNISDDALEDLANDYKIECFRGDEFDVMGRVLGAATVFGADAICEITGDCPLIDADLVKECITLYLESCVDYVNYGMKGGLPDGMGSQVFSVHALRKSYSMTNHHIDREHVTKHIQENPNIFSQKYITAKNSLSRKDIRLTLDYPEDFILLDKIITHFKSQNINFGCQQIIDFLDKNPSIKMINQQYL
jgi:spore coat polysaccharide biosynthesis protein SpsF